MVRSPAPARVERIDGGRYKGVRMRKWGKWVAEVRQPNSRDRLWLGSYGTPEEAGRAYDAAVFCLRGPSAVLNFPCDPPDIPAAGELTRPGIREAAARHARLSDRRPGANGTTLFLGGGDCFAGGTEERSGGGGGGEGVGGSAFYEARRVWSF